MSEKHYTKTEIVFCTGNVGKYQHMVLNTKQITSINIVQNGELDIIEPQMNSMEEIALFKAQYAYKQLKKPVIVQDSGLLIKELNDFPGPYAKYVSQTIGCRGILKLLEGVKDRSCGFDGCIVFVDENGKSHVFNEPNQIKYWGKIAQPKDVSQLLGDVIEGNPTSELQGNTMASNTSSNNPDNNFWTIFVPQDIPGNEKTFVQFSEEKMSSYQKARQSCYNVFSKWLEGKY